MPRIRNCSAIPPPACAAPVAARLGSTGRAAIDAPPAVTRNHDVADVTVFRGGLAGAAPAPTRPPRPADGPAADAGSSQRAPPAACAARSAGVPPLPRPV